MKRKDTPRSLKQKLLVLLLILIALGILAYGAIVGFICYQEVHVPVSHQKADAFIVLGAQVQPSGEPSVQLEWRLQAALDAYRASPALIVVSGGKGPDEPRAEGEVMRDWLMAKGVPDGDILVDNESANTLQNIRRAVKLLEDKDAKHVCIITSDYHLPRALAIARDEGLSVSGIGSPCKREYWAKNHFREALAWVKYWGQKYLHLPLE